MCRSSTILLFLIIKIDSACLVPIFMKFHSENKKLLVLLYSNSVANIEQARDLALVSISQEPYGIRS